MNNQNVYTPTFLWQCWHPDITVAKQQQDLRTKTNH